MKRKTLSLVLSGLMMLTMFVPAFAHEESEVHLVSNEEFEAECLLDKDILDAYLDDTKPVFSERSENTDETIIELFNPNLKNEDVHFYSDFSDGVLDNAEEPISANRAFQVLTSEQEQDITNPTTKVVENFSDLEVALTTSSVHSIYVKNDILLSDALEISRDIEFINDSDQEKVALIAAQSCRHFTIANQDSIALSFNGVVLDGNNDGGGIEIDYSNVGIDGAVIQNCSSNNQYGGGAILSFNGDDDTSENTTYLTIENCTFDENSAEIGGGSIATYNCDLTISTSVITNSSTEKSGGGVMALNFSNNLVSASFSAVTIEQNSADTIGGGLALAGVDATFDEDCSICNNTAVSGGGVFAVSSNTVIQETVVSDNTVSYTGTEEPSVGELGGAGIYAIGKLTLSDATVTNNIISSTLGYGSGVLMVNAALDSEFDDYNGSEELIIESGTVLSGNKGNDLIVNQCIYGGGVALIDVEANISNTTITGNSARYGGGIAHFGCDLTLTSNTIVDNDAAAIGGGLYSSSDCYNTTELDAHTYSPSEIHITNGSVNQNTALVMGGGIYFEGEVTTVNDVTSWIYSLSLENATMQSNEAGLGGAISSESVQITLDSGSNLSNNSAKGENITNLNLEGITYNCAGGCLMAYESDVYVKNASIKDNVVIQDPDVTGQQAFGAAIYAGTNSIITVCDSNAEIKNNTGAALGGGIYADSTSIVKIESGVVTLNTAISGAGVYSFGTVNVSGGEITQNTATENGGGVYNCTGTITMTGGIIGTPYDETQEQDIVPSNTAQNGAGIYSTGIINVLGGVVSQNLATGNGGGVYSLAPLVLKGVTISHNNAMGNGGGVYASKNVSMGGTDLTEMVSIRNNTANGNGGGVYYPGTNATWTMYNGEINENIAHGDGGGVYCCNTRMKWIMKSGEIAANLAVYESNDSNTDNPRLGGGVYCTGTLAKFTLEDGVISDNIANNGGGIYAGCNVDLYGGEITGNAALYTDTWPEVNGGLGGGIYIGTGKTVKNFGGQCSIHNNEADAGDNPDIYVNGGTYIPDA